MNNLSVVILNYNSFEDTKTCVDILVAAHTGINIIIVDNCSIDGSFQKLTDEYKEIKDVSLIKSDKNGGYSYGNNLGIKYAINIFNSKYIGILNPDVIITDISIFDSMCAALDKFDNLAIVGGSTLDSNSNYNPNNSGWILPTSSELIRYHFLINKRKRKKVNWKMIDNNLAQVECVAGCFFVSKAKVLEGIGFLDENVFLYNEENILGFKCKANGYIAGVILDKFYIHNHKKNNNSYCSLRKKINATKNVYDSTKYLCKRYYTPKLLPLLAIMEILNKCYLTLAFVKNKIVGRNDN